MITLRVAAGIAVALLASGCATPVTVADCTAQMERDFTRVCIAALRMQALGLPLGPNQDTHHHGSDQPGYGGSTVAHHDGIPINQDGHSIVVHGDGTTRTAGKTIYPNDLNYSSIPGSAQLHFCPAGPTSVPRAWCDDYPDKYAKVCASFPCAGLGEFNSVTICCCHDRN